MNIFAEHNMLQNRRQFLRNAGMGIGASAFSSLIPQAMGATKGIHHKAKAKRVIFLFMAGAPSQLDMYDYKADLHKLFKRPLRPSVRNVQSVTAMTKGKAQLIAPSKFKFNQHGKSGIHLAETLPHLGKMVDDMTFIYSMNTNAINHDPAKTSFCTGSEIPGKPSMGTWLSYGLGSMNKHLPDFVVMPAAFWSGNPNVKALYSRLWGSGLVPSIHQGVALQAAGDPVLFFST